MKKLIAAIAICGLFAAYANAQDDWVSASYIDPCTACDATKIALTNNGPEGISMLGLDVKSAVGGLLAGDGSPWSITLLDTPDNVVLGNLGAGVDLAAGASLTTAVTFTGEAFGAGGASNVSATWGNGTVPTPVSFPVVPEPASGLMACFAAIGLLGFRRRR